MGQMEQLLADVSRQLGQVLTGQEQMREEQERVRAEHKEIRDRLKALEVASILEGKYGTKEHDDILRRLHEGDALFTALENKAKDALSVANAALKSADSAKHKLDGLKDSDEKHHPKGDTGARHRLALLKILAPYIFAALAAAGGWLAQHVTVHQAVHDQVQKEKGGTKP